MRMKAPSRQHRPWNFKKGLLVPSFALIVASFGLNLWQAIQHTSSSISQSDLHGQSASLESFAQPNNRRQLPSQQQTPASNVIDANNEAAKVKVLEADLVNMSNELKKVKIELLLAKRREEAACEVEFDRVKAQQITGLTKEDLKRSRAWIGNEQRLSKLAKKLEERNDPVTGVVCGGSISMGHGVYPQTMRYSDQLQVWLNYMYPLKPTPLHDVKDGTTQKIHSVFNRGSHGADMCSMAKRMEVIFKQLPDDPDLVILEFAVNDYQGQDHKMHLDHKTDVFYDGFEEKVLCAEAVIQKLLSKYNNTAILFLEFQTAILNRKTAQLLHLGVAQHYQIPVITYAEVMMPGYYTMVEKLKNFHYFAPINDTILPFPHGCDRCRSDYIHTQFRKDGCKSVCSFMRNSGRPTFDCKKRIPKGYENCHLPHLAHDAVHPSKVGHQIARDLIAHAIATTQRDVCQGDIPTDHVLPPNIHFLASPDELSQLTDFVFVKDTMDMFYHRDPLDSLNHSQGFQNYGDNFAERRGWICTNTTGGEFLQFDVKLPQGCYILYLAALKSYEGMGTFTVKVQDNGIPHSYEMNVDGIWKPHISVPSDVAIQATNNGDGTCSGSCTVTILTHDENPKRPGNKVKIMTLSARKCKKEELDQSRIGIGKNFEDENLTSKRSIFSFFGFV